MKHEWLVVVKDPKGTAITDAEVCLVKTKLADLTEELPYPGTAKTHTHDADGKYVAAAEIVPSDGEWLLIVRRKDDAPVVQTLELAGKKGTFTTTAKPRRATTVAMKSKSVKVDDEALQRVSFAVTLHPATEVVFVSGTDMNVGSGIQFHQFAENRRDIARIEKILNPGGLATVFSCDHRRRQTFVQADGAWLLVKEHRFGDAKEVSPGKPHPFVAGKDVSAIEAYKYLSSSVAARAPGSVKEVSWFGHAFGGGPVLWNTWDRSATEKRDPGDHDARPKDFLPANLDADWKDLPKALAKDCKWHTWGCRADTHDRRLIYHGNKSRKLGKTELFTAHTEDKDHGHKIEETLSREWLNWFIDDSFRTNSYCGTAAPKLGLPCFGSPPGVGSDLYKVRGLNVQMIDTTMYSYVYEYLRAEFGPDFKDTKTEFDRGYVDYGPLVKRAALAKPALGPGRYKLTTSTDADHWFLEWENGKSSSGSFKAKLEVAKKTGFGDKKLDGFLYVLEHAKDKTQSVAFFASTESGVTVYAVTRSDKKWDTLGAAL